MKTILALLALTLCSCTGYDLTVSADTPYGKIDYTLPPIIEPTK